MVQLVKNLPAVQETWVQSVGWEDPLEKKMEIYTVTLIVLSKTELLKFSICFLLLL